MKSSFLVAAALTGTLLPGLNCLQSQTTGGNANSGNNPPPAPASAGSLACWLTKADRSVLLQKSGSTLALTSPANGYPFVDVDSARAYQTIDGFGYTLTGGSAALLKQLSDAKRAAVLQELFGNGENSIGVSYLRISIGASDLDATVFSYDDLPAGRTDPTLGNFSLSKDTVNLIPVLKEILAINPSIKILGSPWSPPVWMKDNGASTGGGLLPQHYGTYAAYFVKYIQGMKGKGITVDAVTPQNEPLHGGNNPSMVMTAAQQADFIKNNLGPSFRAAGLTTKIIIYDHNCDRPDYPAAVLGDAAARAFVDGSAFHLYAGDVSALSAVHNAYPTKNLYFTEQWTGSTGSFDGDLKWHIKNVIIGTVRNWSRVALEWNLANDASYGPHTPGGCTQCLGALTIGNGAVSKNVSFYVIAQAAKFVPAGSVRIASTDVAGVPNVAFLTPSGKKVLLALNEGGRDVAFNIRYKGKWALAALPAGTVATYAW